MQVQVSCLGGLCNVAEPEFKSWQARFVARARPWAWGVLKNTVYYRETPQRLLCWSHAAAEAAEQAARRADHRLEEDLELAGSG